MSVDSARKRTIRRYADENGINYTEAATQLSFMAKIPGQPMPIVPDDHDAPWGGLSLEELLAQDWGSGQTLDHWGDPVKCQADNTLRAGRALVALAAYSDQNGGSEPEHLLSDFLGDLRHLCDALGVDFARQALRSDLHYSNEARGQF